MTYEWLGEMFEGESAETCTGKIPLLPMGVRAEGPACADTGAKTPIFVYSQQPLKIIIMLNTQHTVKEKRETILL